MTLSKRAQTLLDRVRNPNGKWYKFGAHDTPEAMQELVDAGLVEVQPRVNVVTSCYVPVGTQPMQYEEFPTAYTDGKTYFFD